MLHILWIFLLVILSIILLLAVVLTYRLYPSLPKPTEIQDRVEMFPKTGHELEGKTEIYFNEHNIPYVFAESDSDAAYSLGLIHAHLRLGQMEIMRRIARGEVASFGGPFFSDIDHTLRIVDFAKTADETWANMPEESKLHVQRFLDGVNFYIRNTDELPLEFKMLRFKKRHWSYKDVLAISKLIGTDINWITWVSLLDHYEREDWPEVWQSLLKVADTDSISFKMMERSKKQLHQLKSGEKVKAKAKALQDILRSFSKNGSNSFVVSKDHSKTGKPLIANDPHLGIALPNFWLIAGVKSPSYDVLGAQIPGLPVFAFGRNKDIAWGGTNLRSAASDLVDISDLDQSKFVEKPIKINAKYWLEEEYKTRQSKYGPVISDSHLFPGVKDKTLALKWVGHQKSDEITSMLNCSKAKNWDEFLASFENFSVPAQNILYADSKGNIGQLIASYIPLRDKKYPEDLIISTKEADKIWSTILRPTDLPHSLNPKEGFVASANNKPTDDDIIIGYFFPIPDRINRIKQVLSGKINAKEKIGFNDLMELQHDVFSESGLALRDVFIKKIEALGIKDNELITLAKNWDGYYRQDSREAFAMHSLYSRFAPDFYKEVGKEADIDWMRKSNYMRRIIAEDLERIDEESLRHIFNKAIKEASKDIKKFNVWGDVHRLQVKHLLGNIPIFGKRFRYQNLPTSGSNDTLYKTAHSIDAGKTHNAYYGAQSRHISDMSDPDENYFVLLGGQDGWHNSSTFADQIQKWLNNGYIKVPMTEKKIRREFSFSVTLNKDD